MKCKRILYVGDGPSSLDENGDCDIFVTGFGQVTKNACAGLYAKGYEVHLLALNYPGDTSSLPYRMYCPSSLHRDLHGLSRIVPLIKEIKPDCVFINNDLPICQQFFKIMTQLGDKMPPLVCYVPVDCEDHGPEHLAWCHRAHEMLGAAFRLVPYTLFGKREWQSAGYMRASSPIGHGLDPVYLTRPSPADPKEVFSDSGCRVPITWEDIQRERIDARIEFAVGGIGPDTFVVMNNDRNSDRKRQNLLIEAYADFALKMKEKEGKVIDTRESDTGLAGEDGKPITTTETTPLIKLWMHMNLTERYDIDGLYRRAMKKRGFTDEETEALMGATVIDGNEYNAWTALPTDAMRRIYLCSDVYLKMAVGEGWGLGPFEAAACGCNLVIPNNSVSEELWGANANLIDCPTFGTEPMGSFTYRIPSVESAAALLGVCYEFRKEVNLKGAFDYVHQRKFQWPVLVERFIGEIETAIAGRKTKGEG